MIRKLLFAFGILALATLILFVSALRTASVRYEFTGTSNPNLSDSILAQYDTDIYYNLPHQGRVLPDSPLWPLKALRDKLWLFVTTNSSRKAELKLLFADKRLMSARILFEKDKPELAFTTLSKGEKYLEEALIQENENRSKGMDTADFLERLANASLKHLELMEEIIQIAPEDAKPKIIELQMYPNKVYELSRDALNEKGRTPPINPFAR